jgi:PAS domain S-box-containing protein
VTGLWLNAQHWLGVAAFVLTGAAASVLFEALRRSQRKGAAAETSRVQLARELESIIEFSPVSIALLRGPDFVYEIANPAYEALAPGKPMRGRTVAEVWPEAADLVMPLLKAVRETQTVYRGTGMAIPRHGGAGKGIEERYFDFAYVPLPGSFGDAGVKVLVVANEVTEYKQTATALRNANQELTTIHANIPVALFIVDDRLRGVKSSDSTARSGGAKLSWPRGTCPIEMVGCLGGLADFVKCGGQRSCHECNIRLAALDSLHHGARHEGIEAFVPVSIDGRQETRWVLVSTAPMELDGKKVLICVQDITSRKQMEEEVARQRDSLRRQAELIGFSHDAIVTINADRIIQGWNKGAEEIYGWTEAEATGQTIHHLLRTGAPVSIAAIDECLTRDERWEGDLSHTRRDGERIIVDSRQVLQRDSTGAAVGILEIDRDITDRRRIEEALQKTLHDLEAALSEKTVLLKEVHHRVKNNLAVICGLLSMNAGATEIPEAKLALDESQRRVYSIALIHEQLYGTDRFDRINFADYARQLVEDLARAFGADGRRISIRIDAEPIEIGVDRAVPCALILNELVVNALKHAFPGEREGEIQISFRESEPGSLELRIEDDGIGCPIEPRWHDRNSTGSRIVNILTKQLGGSLEQAPSAGTKFVLRFPGGTSRRATPSGLTVRP